MSSRASEIDQGLMPEPVFLRGGAETKSKLHERVRGPEQGMDLNDGGNPSESS